LSMSDFFVLLCVMIYFVFCCVCWFRWVFFCVWSGGLVVVSSGNGPGSVLLGLVSFCCLCNCVGVGHSCLDAWSAYA